MTVTPEPDVPGSVRTRSLRKRLALVGIVAASVTVLALALWLLLWGPPYDTPALALHAYITSVEEGTRADGLAGNVTAVTTEGTHGEATISWTGSRERTQVVILEWQTKLGGLRKGWAVATDGVQPSGR